MPVLKHAKKKLRQDKKRTLRNKAIRNLYKKLIKKAEATKSAESVSAAFKQIDKAAKNNIIHDNKAAHLKSFLSKAVAVAAPVKPAEPARNAVATATARGKKAATKSAAKTTKTAKTTKKSTKAATK